MTMPGRPTMLRMPSSYSSRHELPRARGIGVPVERIDYFHQETVTRRNPRALINLGLVATGRVILSLGLGGLSQAFVPPHHAPGMVVGGPAMGPGRPGVAHSSASVLSAVATALGTTVALVGMGSFAYDTWQLSPRRAMLVAGCNLVGVLSVAGGGVVFLYGIDKKSALDAWLASIPRSIGNFLIFGAVPNSFAASELIHGDIPLPHRAAVCLFSVALGGAMLMFWAHITSAPINAPLWAKEVAQSIGIVGILLGVSVAFSSMRRLQAEQRYLMSPREALHATALMPIPAQPYRPGSTAARPPG